nr:MAG TPA: hypothetical protein [Caudoviricetes sp.]
MTIDSAPGRIRQALQPFPRLSDISTCVPNLAAETKNRYIHV